MRMTRAVLMVVLLLSTTSGTISAQPTAVTQPQAAYIALGDSIAFGIGSSLPEKRSYPAIVHGYLEAWSGSPFILLNHSVPGETAESFANAGQLDRYIEAVANLNEAGVEISVVSISLGGNEMLAERYASDGERQAALLAFEASLEDAVAAVRAVAGPDSIVVLTTYYDLSDGNMNVENSDSWWIEQFNQVIRDTAERHDARVADLADLFGDRLTDFTLHPWDVHPKNQGYRAIATQVWSALALDQDPPVITVVSDLEVTRRWSTLQIEVFDNVDVASVQVTAGDGRPVSPVHVGENRYVLLLDVESERNVALPLAIEAVDGAGNVSRIDVEVISTAN